MTNGEAKVLRVTTEAISATEGLDHFRETFGRDILGIEMEPFEGHRLGIDMLLRAFPDFAMASGLVSPMRNHHPASLVKDDDVILTVLSGHGQLTQYGRAAVLENGDAVLTANGAVARFTHYTHGNVINFCLSRAMLATHVADVDAMIAKPISRNNGIIKLILGYASALSDQEQIVPAALQKLVGAHMHELVALLIAPHTPTNVSVGIRAARLIAIKRYISENISRQNLSVGEVSKKLQISETYVRKLLATDETSFTDLVVEMRLLKAHRMLSSPRYVGRTIGSIAHDVGFGDVSYFNRLFRRRFGTTPSEIRGG